MPKSLTNEALNIYFSGSIAGGLDDSALYHQVITHLQSRGRVLTEHLWNAQVRASLDQGLYPPGLEYLATPKRPTGKI